MLSEQEKDELFQLLQQIIGGDIEVEYGDMLIEKIVKIFKPHLQQPPHLHRTSRQEVKIWFDDHVETMGFRPGALVIWKYFESHQQPFDREAIHTLTKQLVNNVIESADYVKSANAGDVIVGIDLLGNLTEKFLINLQALHTGGSEPVSCILPSGVVELLKELAALGSMERALDISSSAIGLSSRANAFGYLWDKPVCGTSKGSGPDFEKGKTVCFECGGSGQKGADTMCKHCKGTGLVCANCGGSGEIKVTRHYPISWTEYESMEPCPACKPEHCPDCDWDVDEVEGSEDMLVKACKKHECQTCGGSGEVYPHKHKVHCAESGCSKIPCPACKEVRYHRSGQGMHLDERGEQRREKAGVFYKDSNLVWIGHRDGVLGSLYVIDSRVSDRRKGD